jgi:hypothetical protein
MTEADLALSCQFGILRRQAYSYYREPMPVVAPSAPITLKIPANIVGEMRAYSVITDLTLSEIVTDAVWTRPNFALFLAQLTDRTRNQTIM